MKKYMFHFMIMIVILAAYIGAHTFAYFSLVKFFGVTSLIVKNFLLWGLIFLSLSFFVSTFLAHVSDNVVTRWFYLSSGFWVGFLMNLCIFFSLVWAVILLGNLFHFVPREKILAIFAIAFAFAYSVYGVWNALNPKVTSLTVSIDNLPKQWIGKKIVQISDVHLGHVYRPEDLAKTVERINSLEPEIVVITGDLFDGTDGSMDSFLLPLNGIKAPTFFVNGNHETYLGLDKVRDAIAKTKIIALRDNLKIVDGLQFIGMDYPLRGADRDVAKIIPKMNGFDQSKPSILLMHEPLQTGSAKKMGISLQLSGHTHVGQLFPFGLITNLVFSGYDYGFKREGSYAIYTSSGLGGWGPPMRTEKRSEIVEITLR